MKLASLFLNGEDLPDELELGEYIVCADGGYDLLAKRGITPDILIGDLDSIAETKPVASEIMRYEPMKNQTDGELAIRHICDQGYDHINIYGAFGGRIDHVYGNFVLLNIALNCNVSARCIGKHSTAYMCNGKVSLKNIVGNTVSIVPFGDSVHIMDSKGLAYPIDDLVIDKYTTIGISNEAVSDVSLKIVDGIALIFVTK